MKAVLNAIKNGVKKFFKNIIKFFKQKGLFSKLVILIIITINILFTIRVLQIFETTSTEPVALISAWFVFTGTELVSLVKIKSDKMKNKKDNESEENEDE